MEIYEFASTSWPWWLQSKIVATSIAAILALVLFWNKSRSGRRPRLPPGPAGLPLLGHLPILGGMPYVSLMKMSQKYGPLMTIRLGVFNTVIVSSPEMVKVILRTQDQVFASHPSSVIGEVFMYGYKDIGTAPYNDHWRHLRRLVDAEIFSMKRLTQLKNVRYEEILRTIESMVAAGRDGGLVDISHNVEVLSSHHISRILFGKRFTGRSSVKGEIDLTSVIKEMMVLAGSFVVGDCIPFLRKLDLGGYEAQWMRLRLDFEKFLEPVIEEHRNKPEGEAKDFLDVMLSLQRENAGNGFPDDQNIKALLQDMIVGGVETSKDTIIWLLTELMRHPDLRQRIVEELDLVVGKDRLVEESDLGSLNCLYAALKETFRMYPPMPLSVPREAVEDTQVAGYDIPKHTRVIMNIYAIGRDPNIWKDPGTFNPLERFRDSPVDVRGQHFELTPFGAGRRKCPGMDMGLRLVELLVAQILHTCDLSLPPGVEVDNQHRLGFTSPKLNPLKVLVTPRLRPELYRQYGINL